MIVFDSGPTHDNILGFWVRLAYFGRWDGRDVAKRVQKMKTTKKTEKRGDEDDVDDAEDER